MKTFWYKFLLIAFIFQIFNFLNLSHAQATTYSENFGSTCFTLNSGITITLNGSNLTTSGTAHFGTDYAGNGAMVGCGVAFQNIAYNVYITFPISSRPTSVSLDAGAVNGSQTIIVNYSDGSTANWSIPDTVNATYPGYVGNFNFSGNGKTITSLLLTPTNNTDYWIMDNLSWNVPTPDTTPPTFTSSTSFSTAENISTSTAAATIKVSESATVTITAGVDAASFTISNSDSVTALIKFKVSPNYESPADSGANNVYDLVLTATDPSSNSGTQTITITVTDVLDTSSFNSLALAGGVTSVTYRVSIQINASVTAASKITFKAANIVIPGCKSLLATGSGSTYTATCPWKPSKRGGVTLSATSTPTNVAISGATSAPISVSVLNRIGSR